MKSAVNGEARTAPDHLEDFLNDVSKLSAAADASRLAIHGNLELARTVLAAAPVSVHVSHFKVYQGTYVVLDTAPVKVRAHSWTVQPASTGKSSYLK
jgi:hypothetical protein